MSVGERDYLSRLQTLLGFLIFNSLAKTKLAILPFLCCGEIVKTSNINLSYAALIYSRHIHNILFNFHSIPIFPETFQEHLGSYEFL